MKPEFEVGGVVYTKAEALALRDELIHMRDRELTSAHFGNAVHLTHMIGLMAVMIRHVWPDPEEKEGNVEASTVSDAP